MKACISSEKRVSFETNRRFDWKRRLAVMRFQSGLVLE